MPADAREVRAIQVAIATSVIGAVTKFTVGFFTGSMSMVSSAVDSLGDLFVSVANLVVVRVAAAEPDAEHNYGHQKIEGLGAMFEGGFIFAAGVFIIAQAVRRYLSGELSHDPGVGIAVMVPLLAMTVGTVLYLRRVATATGSLVVRSDALHYLTDVWVNVGVLVSLVLVKLTGRPVIDSVISVGIALYMLWSSTHIVREGFNVVMDTSLDPDTVQRLQSVLSGCSEIRGYHELKTRAGRVPHVDFHVVVRAEMTAKEVHDLFMDLQRQVRAVVGPSTRVLMHTDPEGYPDDD